MTSEEMLLLTRILSQVPMVTKFDHPDESQAETIVHSLSDLEKSFRTVSNLIPKLFEDTNNVDHLNDVLLEIGEEFRHILYHLRDPDFFNYLFD